MSESVVQEKASLESLVGRVADEFLRRQEQGERPEVEEYTARYPEAAPVLRKVLAALALLERSLAGVAGAETTAAEGSLTGVLGDFRIIQEVGRGGMGIVYEAVQVSLGRRVALKVLPFAGALDPRQLQRFRIEAQAAAHVHHQNIVPVYGVGCERGVHFYAMQYIEGQTVAALIRELRENAQGLMPNAQRMTKHECLSTDEHVPQADARTGIGHSTLDILSSLGIGHSSFFRTVARLGVQAAEALEHAHAKGIIHRDIKPANLLVDVEGNLWITDFGLARVLSEAGLTMTGDLVGTLRYMSPEQALAKRVPVDHRTDIYSLGVTLYELLTLRPVYDGGDRQEILQQIAFEEPRLPRRLNKAIPAELEIIIGKAMGKTPTERYATAQELADDLRCFLDDKPIRAKKPTLLDWTRKWARRHQGIVGTGIAGLILAVGILGISTLVILSWYRTAISNLYSSHVREAKTLRQARDQGYRSQAWQLLQKALALQTTDKDVRHLRQEAVACLGDFVGLEPITWEESEDIHAIALDTRGVQLAIGLSNGSVLLRDLTGKLVGRLPQPPCPIASLAFASDRMLVAVDRDRRAQIWEANASGDWTLARTIAAEPAFVGFIPFATFPFLVPQFVSPMIGEIAITPDGKQLCACVNCSGLPTTIALWNLADGTRTARSFTGPASDQCGPVAFSPDGKYLAAAYFRDHGERPSKSTAGVLVWRLDTGRLERDLSAKFVGVSVLGFSPDGRFVACSGDGGTALFDTSTFQPHLFTRGDAVSSIAFIPDRQLLAIANSCLGRVRLWDYVANREVAQLDHVNQSRNWARVLYSMHHNALVAVSRRVVHTWNLAGSGEKLTLAGHGQLIPDLAFSPDGKLLASAGFDDTLKIWDAVTGQLQMKLSDFRDGVRAPAFSADGRMLAASGGDGVIQIWDVESRQKLAVLTNPEPGRENLSLAFSPNGHYFAACGRGGPGGVTLWRIQPSGGNQEAGGSLRIQPIAGPLNRIDAWNLVFSPDSEWLAWVEAEEYQSTSNTLRFWDLESSRERFSLPVQLAGNIRSLAFHPDRKQLIFVANTGVAEGWDVTARQRMFSFRAGESEQRSGITSVGGEIALSSDGALLASSHGTFVSIWDMASGQFLLKLPEEHSSITGFALSPDGKLLAAGTMDGGLVIWNLPKIKAQLDATGLGW